MFRSLIACVALLGASGFSASSATNSPSNREVVLVTGASGRTGSLVFEQLLNDPRFTPKALVRSASSGKKLRKELPATDLDSIVICDVTKLDNEMLPAGLDECTSMIICTSAVPFVSKLSIVKAIFQIPINLIRRKKALDFRSLRFKWKNNGYPEVVDYQGQVAQIKLAQKLGMKQVIVVSSMGGTQPSKFLNSVGKKPDGSGVGDILLWKRKAERYLVGTGLDYTIIHPGGLVDNIPPGTEEFVIDVDDKLLENKKRSISRADVASLCVAALTVCKGRKVSLDCITRESSGSLPTAEEVLEAFLKEDKVYDYAL
ncbi:hypothetical protein MPSEU_000279000 [Mayamaea pseudoterrestris]|nr:hypothetical protein MPSEU_000279000 [Mayamaea pseudoterrestris]